MRAAGIGLRKGAPGAAIVAAVDAALAAHGLGRGDLDVLAVHAAKIEEPGVAEAAAAIGLPVVIVPAAAAAAQEGGSSTRSARVVELFGVGSMAETVALAAAGRDAHLLGPRTATAIATCAIAVGGEP